MDTSKIYSPDQGAKPADDLMMDSIATIGELVHSIKDAKHQMTFNPSDSPMSATSNGIYSGGVQ